MSLFSQRQNLLSREREYLKSMTFSISTPERIRQTAVKKIVTPLTFDPLGHPIPGGLYDLALGPMNDRSDPCGTCQKSISECSGHMGYIDLPLPVVNPIFHQLIGSILKMACLECFAIQIPSLLKKCLSIQMRLLDCGKVVEASELENIISSISQKFEAREEVSEEMMETIINFEFLCSDIEEKTEKNTRVTKSTEQLRNQYMSNISKLTKKKKRCMFCKHSISSIKTNRNRIVLNICISEEGSFVKTNMPKYVNPDESRKYLRGIWKKDSDFLMVMAPVLKNFKSRENPTDLLYMEVLCVPPPMSRPANIIQGRVNEHPKTNAYRAILQNVSILSTIIYVMKQEKGSLGDLSQEEKDVYNATKGKTAVEKLSIIWESLQSNIDGILDKDSSGNKNEYLGLKQIIEKKQGLLRMHTQGKRVNFSARSVITPDPNLNVDEIGIPEEFAKTLTYPTYVNAHNIEELRIMVMNGPDVHPGGITKEIWYVNQRQRLPK